MTSTHTTRDESSATTSTGSATTTAAPTGTSTATGTPTTPAAASTSEAATPEASALRSMTYEQARARLLDIANKLDRGNIPLEESLRLWEEGEAVAAQARSWLTDARQRVQTTLENAQADQANRADITSADAGVENA
ncbi:MAG: exodeoxyribonuclease VII small subunit [Actinomycetaceae bacterium]|nr:exodeoxyribonuclease VII small subunit [Actinomycetaceae bacterium]MDY6083563.1 exodeoxyribonuclease VII small subunit [Actinomycetaceae bacterium]